AGERLQRGDREISGTHEENREALRRARGGRVGLISQALHSGAISASIRKYPWYTAASRESAQRGLQIAREITPAYHFGIKDLPSAMRPRERLESLGAQALSDDELIAIILRTGTQGSNVLEVARALVSQFGGLGALNRASLKELSQARGLGPVKAIDLKAAFELGKRLL